MKKKDLINKLEKLNDDDIVVIEVHDMSANEGLYSFYVDPIEMGEGRGNEIRLTIEKPETETWFEAYVSDLDDQTATIFTSDTLVPLFQWYAKLPPKFEVRGEIYDKSDIHVDKWVLQDNVNKISANIF